MENFFGKMKNEMFYGHQYEFETLDQLKEVMEEYIIIPLKKLSSIKKTLNIRILATKKLGE